MENVKDTILKFARLIAGLFVCAVGMVMTINANLGLSPWDVFHHGLSKLTGLTLGRANIVTGLSIVILDIIFGERVGWGTILNMLLIGLFIDFLMFNKLIPIFDGFIPSIIMMVIGMFLIGIGCFLYIGVGFGSGPRDGLMVALVKKTKKSVRLIRSSLEVVSVAIGYILGGSVGIGTLIMAFTGGYFMQLAFKVTKFDVGAVEHRFIDDDIRFIKEKLLNKKQI
ncbi:MAG: hypothetical protein GXY88_07455 [Tissierellia bacterium]|nr:hypothetical protein [Tissierellia bacterium]